MSGFQKVYFILGLTIFSFPTQAQSLTEKISDNLLIEYSPVVSSENPLDTLVQITCHIDLNDTSNVESIDIKAGSEMENWNVINKKFNYSKDNTLSPKMKFKKNGKRVSVTLGEFFYKDFFYSVDVISNDKKKVQSINHHKKR